MLIKIIISVLVIIILFFIADSYYERRHFIIKEYIIADEKIPSEFDGAVFAAMTDLHNNEFGDNNGKLIKAIRDINPDAILCGGDMIVSKGIKSMDVPEKLMKTLASEYRVYYCYGNHEARLSWKHEVFGNMEQQYYDALKDAGVCVINDKKITFSCGDGKLTIAGLDLEKKYYKKLKDVKISAADIERKIGAADEASFNILLAHSPVSFENYAEWGANLVLSGHFHGGTVILPFAGGLMSPDYILFPKYYRGRFDEYGSTMIVSGGLGTHSVNIRINNRPELIVLKLKRK